MPVGLWGLVRSHIPLLSLLLKDSKSVLLTDERWEKNISLFGFNKAKATIGHQLLYFPIWHLLISLKTDARRSGSERWSPLFGENCYATSSTSLHTFGSSNMKNVRMAYMLPQVLTFAHRAKSLFKPVRILALILGGCNYSHHDGRFQLARSKSGLDRFDSRCAGWRFYTARLITCDIFPSLVW